MRFVLAIDEMESALIVACWLPGGRQGLSEGGAWGWCLAKDWGPSRMGQERWVEAKIFCAQRSPTHHLVAIEDAMSSMLERVCEAGLRGGLPILSAQLSASGGVDCRRVEAMCSYREGLGTQVAAKAAVDIFFQGLPHCVQLWTPEDRWTLNPDRLRSQLAPVCLAWCERLDLESQTGEGSAGKSTRI
jgi:hypothetical protein